MKKYTTPFNFILLTAVTLTAIHTVASRPLSAEATSISDIQSQINNHTQELEGINNTISHLADEQDILEEQISDLNSEIINTMASIGMKEEEIATKETELADTQVQIDQAQIEYEKAKELEEQQYEAMLTRIRLMYESSNDTYLSFFLTGDGMGDILDRMDYMEAVYEYDDEQLIAFQETKNQVQELWDELERNKAQLEADKTQLETDKQALVAQQSNLDQMLAEKKRKSSNYDAEIKKYQQEAAVTKRLLQQEQQTLKKLQAEQNKGNTSAATGSYTSTNYTNTIDNASGSDLGKRVAKYGCQYIGNPYVSGGTSLTNGADCSGFTYRIYQDFGYSIPRTSYEQRNAGTGVSYSEAQPGDIICYEGHVGIYIGGGLIVHASTERTGIKVSNAQYRTILTVRRIV